MNLRDGASALAVGLLVAFGLAACHGDTEPSPLDAAVANDAAYEAAVQRDASTSLDAGVPLDVSSVDPFAGDAGGDGGVADVCRASKTWRFETGWPQERALLAYRRSDGFVLGDVHSSESATFLFLGESEPRTAQTVIEPLAVLRSLPIGTDRSHVGALLFSLGRDESGADTAVAQQWSAFASSPGPLHTLGKIFRRGSMAVAVASSLDGQRALFTTAHVAVQPPVAFLVDGDGARVGDALAFSVAPADLHLPDCLAVTPTAHAAAFSVLGSDTQTWRFKEIAADGAVVQEVSFHFDRVLPAPCPTISPTPAGFIAAFDRGDGSFQLLKVAAGRVESRIVAGDGHTLPTWLGETTTGRLLWLDRQTSSLGEVGLPLSLLFEDGAFRTIDEDVGPGQVIASEAGHLYVLRPAAPPARAIEELRCRGVELAN